MYFNIFQKYLTGTGVSRHYNRPTTHSGRVRRTSGLADAQCCWGSGSRSSKCYGKTYWREFLLIQWNSVNWKFKNIYKTNFSQPHYLSISLNYLCISLNYRKGWLTNWGKHTKQSYDVRKTLDTHESDPEKTTLHKTFMSTCVCHKLKQKGEHFSFSHVINFESLNQIKIDCHVSEFYLKGHKMSDPIAYLFTHVTDVTILNWYSVKNHGF